MDQTSPHSLASFVPALRAADPEIRKDMMRGRTMRLGGSYLVPDDCAAITSHLVEIQLYGILGRAPTEDAAIQDWIDCATRVVPQKATTKLRREFSNHAEEIASIRATDGRADDPYNGQGIAPSPDRPPRALASAMPR